MSPSHPAFPKGCVSCLVRQLCSNSRQRGIFLNAIPLIKTVCTLWLKHIRIHSEAWRLATSLDLHFQFDYRPHPSSEQCFDACTGVQWEALQGGVAENTWVQILGSALQAQSFTELERALKPVLNPIPHPHPSLPSCFLCYVSISKNQIMEKLEIYSRTRRTKKIVS